MLLGKNSDFNSQLTMVELKCLVQNNMAFILSLVLQLGIFNNSLSNENCFLLVLYLVIKVNQMSHVWKFKFHI